MFRKFEKRSHRLEHIDTGDYTAEEYEACLSELQLVNKWMGDARTLRRTFFLDVSDNNLKQFSVLDVAAGSGQLLRLTVEWAREHRRNVFAVGLELNERSAHAIVEQSLGCPEISSIRGDALKLPFQDGAFDYVISSLFTHHLTDDQIVQALQEMCRVTRRRIFIIDLHRHPMAYLLYTTLGKLVLHNRLIREDGALSILRSFKPAELSRLASRSALTNFWVNRHFPFRLVLSASATNSCSPVLQGHPLAVSINRAA